MSNTETSLVPCKYGLNCYRQNPMHFHEYSHPVDHPKSLQKRKLEAYDGISNRDPAVTVHPPEKVPKTEVPEKVLKNEELSLQRDRDQEECSLMSHYKFSQVTDIPDSFYNAHCPSICDILSRENLECSVQFNYMIDIDWLMKQYRSHDRRKPVLLVHGSQGADKAALHESCSSYSNITLSQASLPMPFGTHHTKMMILKYDTGLVVVVHTANLVQNDWYQKTQGIWISPYLPVQEDSTSLKVTTFQSDLVAYLKAYNLNSLKEWIEIINKHDFTGVKAHLVGSVPGRHTGSNIYNWGHLKLQRKLTEHISVSNRSFIVGQFSSIGSLGSSEDNWLTSEFLSSLSSSGNKNNETTTSVLRERVPLKLVYPCVEDVRCSLEGYIGGGCLPYFSRVAAKQAWLTSFFHKWRAEKHGRTRACPHIKTYTRVCLDEDKNAKSLNWFLLTSANLSKAAWGVFEKNKTQLMIRSYELGVLLIPEELGCSPAESLSLLPFDLPLQKYSSIQDEPWIVDKKCDVFPDSHGVLWCPP